MTGHLVPLGDSGWRLWRLSALRSAGFPADRLDLLVDPDLADAAGQDTDQETFAAAYLAAAARLSANLATAAADPLFREAVAWQSPHLLATCVDKVAAEPVDPTRLPGSKQRQRQLTTASYLQRYALKNDSIGFFGPVGWARWTGGAEALRSVPHERMLARRTVCFETWAADAVARALSRDPRLFPWLRPKASPQNVVGPQDVRTPRGKRITLPAAEHALVSSCDGQHAIGEITAEALARGDFATAEEVHAALLALQDREILSVDLGVVAAARPLDQLRDAVTEVPDDGARRAALATLDRMDALRDAVATAAGDPDKLLAATAALEAAFEEITGQDPARRAGETYAGRTLVYEDTVRGVDVELGAPVAEALAGPLAALLDGARWLVAEAAEAYRRRFDEIFDRLRARTGADTVPLAVLYGAATPDMVFSFRELPPLVDEVIAEFRRRWQRVLEVPEGGTRHQITLAQVAEGVAREFPRRPVPWSAAVHHAPDVMIAAADPEAVARGEFLAVLGELHASANTLESRLFVEQAGDPAEMLAADESDHGRRRVIPVLSKESGKVNSRTTPSALLSPQYTYWAMYPDGASTHDDVLPAAALHVHRADGELVVKSDVDGRTLPLLEVLGEVLGSAVMNGFSLLPPARHRPRVTVDRFVVARESWRFDAAELDWAGTKDPAARFRAAWRWHRANGLPRRAFYRVPVEDKPLFVDFASIALVELFARSVRRTHRDTDAADTITLSEMLPDLPDTWLRDAEGNRYTSELRLVAVTPEQEPDTPVG